MSTVEVGEAGVDRRKHKARALLNKLYGEGYRVILSPNGSIRVGHADTGEVPDDRLQRVIIDYRFELKSLCDPKLAEREDLWGKALRWAALALHERGVEAMPESIHLELEYAQQHWENDDVGGARYHLMRAYAKAQRATDEEVDNGSSRRTHAGGRQDPDSAHGASNGAVAGAGAPAEGAPDA